MAKISMIPEQEKAQLKTKLLILKDLLNECKDEHIKTWLRDKINELLIEFL